MAGPVAGRGEDDFPEPPRLRSLRRLVTLLTVVMIVGIATVVAMLVIRLAALGPTTAPALPAAIALPAGERAGAVTFGAGWVAVVTIDGAGVERIRLFDAATGAPRDVLEISPGA